MFEKIWMQKSSKYDQTEFNSRLKESYTMIKCDGFQGCKNSLTSANQFT